jgi:hypothetical protein
MKYAGITHILGNKWIYPILLTVSTFVAYFPVMGNGFLYVWDDQWVVINSYTESGWSGQNLWAIFTEFYHGQYAPLNELLYLTLYTLFGYKPFWFHLASLLLHVANALLVYVCIYRLLELSRKIFTDHKKAIAFFTALIFAIHPFNVESVAWMSASKVLVYSFFYLLATLSFLAYLKKGKLKYYFFTLLFFVCSFLGKEQAVSFPLWLLLVYWVAGYSFKNKKVWFAVTPFLLLSLTFGIITILSQTGGGSLFDQTGYPVWQRLVYACYTFIEYFLKSAFPFKLSYLYPFPSVEGDPLPPWLLLYPLLLIVLLLVFWKSIVANKTGVFCLLFFGIHIAVALHIISLSRFAVVADRYVYLASVGVSFLLAYSFVYFIKKWKSYLKSGLIVAFSVFLLYFGIYTNIRSRVWHDSNSLKKEIRELLKERNDYEIKDKN